MISYYFGDTDFWETFIRIIVFGIAFFVVAKFYRKTYLIMINTLEKGWVMLCAVPLFAYMSLYPVIIKNIFTMTNEFRITIMFYMISLVFNYFINARFFQIIAKENFTKLNIHYLQTQIEAMQEQSKNYIKVEDKIKIYRHDMRHFLNKLSILLKQGDIESSLVLICEQDKSLQEIYIKKYCDYPIVNAIINYNFGIIIKSDIALEYEIKMLDNLPINEIELSNLIANALENARNACSKLPTGEERYIKFNCNNKEGKLILEITNTYNGDIKLDKKGYPITYEEGHGIGTNSITELTQKYNAVINYQTKDKIFRLSLLFQ